MTEYETPDRAHKVFIRDERVVAFVGESDTRTSVLAGGQFVAIYGNAATFHEASQARMNKQTLTAPPPWARPARS